MDFKELVQQRRSHRKFTGEEVSAEDVKMILRAALMSPTSKGQRAWQFVVVDDKTDLEKLSDAKDMGGCLFTLFRTCLGAGGVVAVVTGHHVAEALQLTIDLAVFRRRVFDLDVATAVHANLIVGRT